MFEDPLKAKREREARERQARLERERRERLKREADEKAKAKEKEKQRHRKREKERQKAEAEPSVKPKAKPTAKAKAEPAPEPSSKAKAEPKPKAEPSQPIAQSTPPQPKELLNRLARGWTGEEADPEPVKTPSPEPTQKVDLQTYTEEILRKHAARQEERRQNRLHKESESSETQTGADPEPVKTPSVEPSQKVDLQTYTEEVLRKYAIKQEERRQKRLLKEAESSQAPQEHSLTPQTHSRFPAPLLSDLLASPSLNLNSPEIPLFGGIGSVEPTLVAGPPQSYGGWNFNAITAKPMGSNIEVEVAALQQKYKLKNAQFFRHLVQMRQEQAQKQRSVLELAAVTGDYKSAARIYGYDGINPGQFSLRNHTQNPTNGNHNYDVSFDLAAAQYYNKIAGVEWVKWNQEKAKIAAAELQGERNAREFIAKLPSATAEDKEQLEQVKQRQAQVKKYDASLRQHMAKHQRMAANAPVEKLNFNHQYVVPGSLSTLSQQPSPQTVMPSQSSTSNTPFTIPGTQQGEEASQYWANLYVQGEQQGGLTGIAKQAVAFPMGMLSSLWTKDTALQTAFTLGTSGLGALAGAGKLGAASMPVLRTMQIGGAFGSGTSIGQGISGKDMFTGEDLSPLDRGFHLTFGAAGAGLDLGGAGLRLGNLSKSFPTVTKALEGVSAPQVTRKGGQLGLSNQGGSIKLGGQGGEVPKGTGKAEPEPGKQKATEPPTKKTSVPKGLVNVVEEDATETARWFARYDNKGNETFSVRLNKSTNNAEISWTENVGQIADNLAEVQAASGQKIPRISGMASDGIEKVIKAGKFNSDLYEKHLSRRLGGKWKIEAIQRTDLSDIWDINARRIGD